MKDNRFISSTLPTGDVTKCLKEYKEEVPSTACAEGPYYKYYKSKGYSFRPPIRYKTCNRLTCQGHYSCVAKRSYVKFKWTTACKCDGLGGCIHTERRCVRFIEQTECQCKCAMSFYDCRLGYVWNPIECKCVREECPPTHHFDSTNNECIEDLKPEIP